MNEKNMIKKDEYSIEEIFKFIASYLNIYEKINLKDGNKLSGLEKEFDTLDFNEVSYLVHGEIKIEQEIYDKIQKFEEQIRELYIRDELRYKEEKNKKIISICYGNTFYDIIYDNNVFTYKKSKNVHFGTQHACGLDFFINNKIKKLER